VDETRQVSKNEYEVYTTIKLEEQIKNNLKAEKKVNLIFTVFEDGTTRKIDKIESR